MAPVSLPPDKRSVLKYTASIPHVHLTFACVGDTYECLTTEFYGRRQLAISKQKCDDRNEMDPKL
jgi:hypothetical protein